MKIVFQKVPQWEGVPNAEAELARRMLIATETIGINALATSHIFIVETHLQTKINCNWLPG
jgi:hypothetical protein